MAETLTWNRLRELAGFRSDGGCAISLYVNLDPTLSPTAQDVDTRVSSMLSDAEKRIDARRDELTHAQREGLKGDLVRIRAYFDNEFSREGAQGFTIFAAGAEYWSTLALAYPVPDAVKLGREFHLATLAPLVGRGDGAIVAVVGRERGELFRLRAGRLEEVVDRTEEQPGRHDQGGWSQARYQRHIEKLVGEHLRDVAAELDREVKQLHTPKVVLVGAEATRSEFLETLPHEAKSAVVGTAEAEAHAGEPELLELVQPLLDEAHASDEAAVLDRWREEVAKQARGAAGWKDTLEAASDARVELLLYDERADRPAYQCPKCGRASLDGGECPLDGTPMEERDSGFDLAVHQTVAHGGTLLAVRHHDDLGPVEGIGALLRY
jgi:peptide chain release factor subunit 1